MRYDKVTKTHRNQQLYEYAEKHSELSQEEIGEVFRISRQRVSKLLQKMKLLQQKKAG